MLERREEIIQVGAVFLRRGSVIEADLRFLFANGAEKAQPFAILRH